MAAFNYRLLIHQVPARTWQFYFNSRKIDLQDDRGWNMPAEKLITALVDATDALEIEQRQHIYSELRRVHALANRRGVDALRNIAKPDAALHEDFLKLSSDAERALWVMANWPDLFTTAEVFHQVNLRVGKRGWKRLLVGPAENLFRAPEDIRALEKALAIAFTTKKGTPRACQIDVLDRHLDGGVQLGIKIEDNAQRQLEFGDDDRLFWRNVRPPLAMDIVIYPTNGVVDILASGGGKVRQELLTHLGTHVFRKTLQPQAIKQPLFFLNRLRYGFDLFDDSQVDLAIHRVEHIRLSQAKVRPTRLPACDFVIKPPGDKEMPDVLDCLKTYHLEQKLMGADFNIVDAVVTLYFLPTESGKARRVLHAELKQSGISNLSDMDASDAQLVEALLIAWGVIQPLPAESTSLAAAEVFQ